MIDEERKILFHKSLPLSPAPPGNRSPFPQEIAPSKDEPFFVMLRTTFGSPLNSGQPWVS